MIITSCASDVAGKEQDVLSRLASQADTSYPQLIFLVNPNDCISCLGNFTNISGQLKHKVPAQNIVMIFPERRPVEQEKIKKQLIDADMDCQLVWDSTLFNSMFDELHSPTHQSHLVIKKYGQTLYAKPVKDIAGIGELEGFFREME